MNVFNKIKINRFTQKACLRATQLSVLLLSLSTHALTLTSSDIQSNEVLANAHVFKGFGCEGDNVSPQLSWQNAPEGTKSFAITVYDPDAPTGSGWWHWQVVNIPQNVTSLAQGAGEPNSSKMPKGSVSVKNDYSVMGYGGACPPIGDGSHRYRFTVHALAIETISLPKDPSGALTGYMINANTLASSTIEAVYERK